MRWKETNRRCSNHIRYRQQWWPCSIIVWQVTSVADQRVTRPQSFARLSWWCARSEPPSWGGYLTLPILMIQLDIATAYPLLGCGFPSGRPLRRIDRPTSGLDLLTDASRRLALSSARIRLVGLIQMMHAGTEKFSFASFKSSGASNAGKKSMHAQELLRPANGRADLKWNSFCDLFST